MRVTSLLLTACLGAAVDLSPPTAAAEDRPPNILFVFADDLGFGDIAAHGHDTVKTPHLDRLAREGTDFQQFVVASGVCSPSRTAVMTGQYPARHRVHGHFAGREANARRGMPDFLDPAAPLLSRMLHKAGYATGHFGKWHLSGHAGRAGSGDVADPRYGDIPPPAAYAFDASAVYVGAGPDVFTGTEFEHLAAAGPDAEARANALSPAATTHAVDFIRRNADHPWFVNLWLHETHHLVSATDEEKALYPDVAEPRKTYLAAVTRMDACVGRVLSTLDELGLAGDTLVVFSSDNGPENSHAKPGQKLYHSVGSAGDRRGRKRSLYMGGVNTPFLVRWPGQVPAGRVDNRTLIGAVDLLPTFLEAAGVAPPDGYESDGQSVLSAFRGELLTREQPLLWQWNADRPTSPVDWPHLGVRDGRFALVSDGRGRTEMYDVLADPGQTNDLSDADPDTVARLLAAATAWEQTLPEAPRATTRPARKPADSSPAADDRRPANSGAMTPRQRAAAFAKRDQNRDGRMTLDEYLSGFGKPEKYRDRFATFDANADGFVTPAEYGAVETPQQ